jgi:hypothetical protein
MLDAMDADFDDLPVLVDGGLLDVAEEVQRLAYDFIGSVRFITMFAEQVVHHLAVVVILLCAVPGRY